MRVAGLLALGCYAAVARADVLDDAEDVKSSLASVVEEASSSAASVVESVTSSMVELPTFTPTTMEAPFLEQFLDDSRWQRSNAKKENTDEEWQYVGTWSVEEPTVLRGMDGDKGLVLKDKAAHHAISAKFDKPIDNKGETLIIQYEVKLQSGLECGGAYMKLLQDNKALQSDEFSNASPYVIMFGPDKCGSTNKVHFIFRHKNPKTGEYEEKHMKAPPTVRISKLTTLYTLIVKPDQTFEIVIDGESVKTGSLLEDFTPPVNPEKEIDDPDDSKPSDWVNEARIPDKEAVKPEDWDEEAPREIPDDEAEKPADWLDDEPLMVSDPEAEKPEDWDDEEDGDWIAPMVSNPKCDEVSGCGAWEQPTKENPDYKGKWTAPLVDNPLWKGFWKARRIANPGYYDDQSPANFEPMGAIGFELWTMQNDILFDNIYIGHSLDDAIRLRRETYDIKHAVEKAEDDKDKAKTEADKPVLKSPNDLKFMDDPVLYVTEKWNLFVAIAQRDPVEAVKHVPEVAGALGLGVVTILGLLITLLAGPAAKAAPSKEQVKEKVQEAKDAALKAKDQAAESVSSGVEKAKEEVNKRTTRSAAKDE